jgi:hypothetical protein
MFKEYSFGIVFTMMYMKTTRDPIRNGVGTHLKIERYLNTERFLVVNGSGPGDN